MLVAKELSSTAHEQICVQSQMPKSKNVHHESEAAYRILSIELDQVVNDNSIVVNQYTVQ